MADRTEGLVKDEMGRKGKKQRRTPNKINTGRLFSLVRHRPSAGDHGVKTIALTYRHKFLVA